MFKDLKSIIKDNKMKITILENKVNVSGYKDILLIEDNTILLDINKKIIKVSGKNLLIKKLLSDEVLIEGEISSVTMG